MSLNFVIVILSTQFYFIPVANREALKNFFSPQKQIQRKKVVKNSIKLKT